jgi:hypothetical protein
VIKNEDLLEYAAYRKPDPDFAYNIPYKVASYLAGILASIGFPKDEPKLITNWPKAVGVPMVSPGKEVLTAEQLELPLKWGIGQQSRPLGVLNFGLAKMDSAPYRGTFPRTNPRTVLTEWYRETNGAPDATHMALIEKAAAALDRTKLHPV